MNGVMLFRSTDLKAIVEGERTVAFRRWKKPTARAGGIVKTQVGLVGIDSIETVDPDALTEAEARQAGYRDLAALKAMLDSQEGTCYRIRLHYAGPDSRPSLADNDELSDADREKIATKLKKLDASSDVGPWTMQTLRLIEAQPGLVARELCKLAGRERDPFKEDVRKLKALGLTISLEVGYRLSPRGRAYLEGS
jgi:hypothetical protein